MRVRSVLLCESQLVNPRTVAGKWNLGDWVDYWLVSESLTGGGGGCAKELEYYDRLGWCFFEQQEIDDDYGFFSAPMQWNGIFRSKQAGICGQVMAHEISIFEH